MRNIEIILDNLNKHNYESSRIEKIYRNFYNPEFYKLAYNNIYAKPSQMTPASDGSTIDGMSLEKIDKLCEKLRTKTYQPTCLRRINIPKKNGTTKPISIPSFEDKLVQEVCRILLNEIYEESFSDFSHGFRPDRSCHSALEKIRQSFKGTKWFLEGDIKSCFDSIHHETLLNILKLRIKDNSFIHLINLFLKNGYMENQVYHKTYSGTPQGSIISPILCNIYLDRFDKFMENIKSSYDKFNKRIENPEHSKLRLRLLATKKRIENGINVESNLTRLKEQEKEFKKWKGSTINEFDTNFRRFYYIRYADDFLIGIIGPKQDIIQLKNHLIEWFKNNLKLELSNEKTRISHNSEKIRFLGYDIIVVKNSQKKLDNGNIKLSVPYDIMINFIISNHMGKWWNSPLSGKDELKAIHRPELINLDPMEIAVQYNLKIRGLYNYYKLAENVYKLSNFNYIVQTSYARTLANKFKTTRAKLYKEKIYFNGNTFGCPSIKNNNFYELFNGPFEKKLFVKYEKDIDIIPITNKFQGRNSLISRLEANKCEYCGDTMGPFEVHHIKHMKNIKSGKQNWQKLMIARKRKTLVLCKNCHIKLHSGNL